MLRTDGGLTIPLWTIACAERLNDVGGAAASHASQPEWYPLTVSWSTDGTTLLYAAWNYAGQPLPGGGESLPGGVIAVPADLASDATLLIDSIDPVLNYYSHRWAPIQMWGRQPG